MKMSDHEQLEKTFSFSKSLKHPLDKVIDCLKLQWNSPVQKNFLIFKTSIVTLALGLLILNSVYNIMGHKATTYCLQDRIQDWTEPITLYFENNDASRNILIIISSLMIDINFIALGFIFIFYGNSLRIAILIFTFYIVRAFLQRIFFMPYPRHFIFLDPGFFSLSVPYIPSNDFFFSGHVGMCTLFFLDFKKERRRKLQWLAFVTILLNTFTLLITRAHYSIDLPIGILTAHYLYRLSLLIEEELRKIKSPILLLCYTREKEDMRNKKGSTDNEYYVKQTDPTSENNINLV